MREVVGCVLGHEEAVQAVSVMAVTCPECRADWELEICQGHGKQLNLLIVNGGSLTCPCGARFPMLYNVSFWILA